VQGNPVVKHRALERLSSALRIIWHKPEVLRAERDEAVLIVTGNLPSEPLRMEHRRGRHRPEPIRARNKTAIYPYAMAEKRAKDRVILKLAGLYGSHSEEEADDFKQGANPNPNPREVPGVVCMTEDGPRPATIDDLKRELPAVSPTKDSRSVYVENSLNLIGQIQTPEAVSAWLDREVEQGVWKQYGITEHQDDGKAILMACKRRRLELRDAA
jgi:hypothetical protein